MRTVQETFNRVIELGYYKRRELQFMCHSLRDAREANQISYEEYKNALEAIKKYMAGTGCVALITALIETFPERVIACKDCFDIYIDWVNRPVLKKG